MEHLCACSVHARGRGGGGGGVSERANSGAAVGLGHIRAGVRCSSGSEAQRHQLQYRLTRAELRHTEPRQGGPCCSTYWLKRTQEENLWCETGCDATGNTLIEGDELWYIQSDLYQSEENAIPSLINIKGSSSFKWDLAHCVILNKRIIN